MRSPRASMKMVESAVTTPARRWQPVQSISSRASAANTRSPFESSPGGPPSGPASAARPPSRATATAALAAQPPLTMKKLCAWVFASGCGKRSTRNTSSSTMIPAHKIARAAPPALAELNLFLHPGADDVVGDGHGRRRGQAVGMTPQQHARDLFAVEPAGIVELRAIDDDLARERLGMTADHQRGGKGPGLRGEIAHASANDAGLFARFPPHGIFDRLPGLDEPGEARPHAGLKAIRAAEHAALARDRKHDHDRIRAREMLRAAGWAIASPAGFDEIGRGPAIRAKAMARMPVEQRLAFGERRQMVGLDQATHRDRAQIGDDELVPCFEHLRGRPVERDRESRRVLAEAEKNEFRRAAERARVFQREQRIGKSGGFVEDHQLAGDHIGARVRVALQRRERRRVRAPFGRALDRACGVTETRLGAEIGAGRHGTAPAGHRRWPVGAVPCGRFTKQAHPQRAKHCAAFDRARWHIAAWCRVRPAGGTSPRRPPMHASVDNAPQNSAPFVDQRPNGPGVSKIDPSDAAAPMYRLLAKMRSPVTLRDLMIHPVRTGYIGQEQPIAAADLPKSAAELYPEIGVSEVAVPSPPGRIRCQVFSPPASKPRGGLRPMMLYLHGGGFTLGQSEDTAYITSRIAAENTMVVVSVNYRLV